MDYRYLGKSGLKVSAVGVGCNNFGGACDQAATTTVVNKALDGGITLFDTADYYGQGKSETFLGKALGVRRKDVIIATKFGLAMGNTFDLRGGGSRDYILRAVEASLRRLGTDYIDLYQLHVPDADTPVEETLSTLDTLVRQGKVRYIGHSNFTGGAAADAAWTAKTDARGSYAVEWPKLNLRCKGGSPRDWVFTGPNRGALAPDQCQNCTKPGYKLI